MRKYTIQAKKSKRQRLEQRKSGEREEQRMGTAHINVHTYMHIYIYHVESRNVKIYKQRTKKENQ